MTAVLLPNGKQQFFTTPGVPAVGYKLATFAAGTSSNQATWADALQVTPNTNPIILDARGEAVIFWNGAYKVQLQDSTGIPIWTVDNVQSNPQPTSSFIPTVDNSFSLGSATFSWANVYIGADHAPVLDTVTGNIGYYKRTAAEIAAGVTPSNLSYLPGNALRYGVDPTGVADSTLAMQKWINAAWAMYNYADGQGLWNGGGGAVPVLTLPPGKFLLSGTLYLPAGCTITGTGHPANTTSHTRLIMNSTGLTPGRTWSATTTILPGSRINAGNGYNFVTSAGGVTGGSTPAWITSAGTVGDGTVTWTWNGANTAGDNRNVPMFRFGRGSLPRVGSGPNGTLTDSAMVITIQELEFWYVSINGTFSNPLSGSGYAVGDYPLGAVISCDVDMADCRVVDCCFQSCPAALWGSGIGTATLTRGDGFTGNRGIGMFFENCEFDAASAHVFLVNCALNLWFKECLFFNTSSFYGGCTGSVNYLDCYFEFGSAITSAFIDAGLLYGANTFGYFVAKGNVIESPSNFPWLYLKSVGACIDISQNSLMTAAVQGGITVNGANSGSISNNVMNNLGFNASAGTTPADFIASINAQNCQNLKICDNVLSSNSAATYGGFGILVVTNGGTTSQSNFVSGNCVTVAHTGANYSNAGLSQGRRINIAPTDIRGINYEAGTGAYGVRMGPYFCQMRTLTYSASMTPDCSYANEFDIAATNNTAFTITNPINGNIGQEIVVWVSNQSGGSLGAITWGANYKMLGFTSPINGGSCAIRFRYDGTNWTQTMPQTLQVPN